VAATVVKSRTHERLAVLSAIGPAEDHYFVRENDDTGAKALEALADSIAWIIPEAVPWLLPDVEEVNDDTT
jgi:hypothetical protein